MTSLEELKERVEKASGADREIDVHLWLHFGWSQIARPGYNDPRDIHGPDDLVNMRTMAEALRYAPNDIAGIARAWNVPRLTASLDAALALVEAKLPGWRGGAMTWDWNSEEPHAVCELLPPWPEGQYEPPEHAIAKAKTLPLALLSALLSALDRESVNPARQ